MASYVVAAALFIMGTSYLVQFVVEPPGTSTSGLDHLTLKSQGEQALEVLLGTQGMPRAWGASSADIDQATASGRLGLLESGSGIRVNTSKFDALASGKYATTSNANGAVDYAEAKAMLGLDGYEFHLRAYPIAEITEPDSYGVEDMEDFDVAYIGRIDDEDTWSANAENEADALDNIAIAFTNAVRAEDPLGDVFYDESVALRQDLLPSLGANIQQEEISQGAGTKYDFYRVDPEVYGDLLALNLTGGTSAMALSTSTETLGYTKNRELRAILGSANLTGATANGDLATIHWWEWVDTDRDNGTTDCGDYGYVEVSGDGGATWVKLTDTAATRSQDCSPLYLDTPGLALRSADIQGTACASCKNNANVLVAFHWIADNDNTGGYGWVVDDVQVTNETDGKVLFRKTFETPEYDLLVVGSDVDHDAFTPEEVKAGIRDYVDLYGGRIVVLGGQNNVQWLDRLFDAAVGGASGGVASPDSTHPILTLPNELSYTDYVSATPWDFSSSEDAGLFSTITGSDEDHPYLTVSRQGAWGEGDTAEGAVILTSYKPGAWGEDETKKFFANTLLYGRFHYLYLEVGPPVPDGEMVASVTRSATMNKHREGYDPEFIEMAFIMYVWPGASTASTLAQTSVNAMQPRGVTVEATDRQTWINWTPPLSVGTATANNYEIWRGNSPSGITTLIANVTATAAASYSYHNTGLTNGTAYWYNVTMITKDGDDWFRGSPSTAAGAVPIGPPTAPGAPAAANGLTTVDLTWTTPGWTGPGPLYGYAVWGKHSGDPSYTLLAEIGNVTSYSHSPPDTEPWVYTVAAINARGYGPASGVSNAGQVLSPAGAPTLAVTNLTSGALTLSWAAPSFGGSSATSYHVDRSADGAAWTHLAETADGANVSFIDEEIADNATWHYRVAAVTAVGDGVWSDPAQKQALGAPWTPGELTKTSSVNTGVSATMSFTWAAPSDGGSPILSYSIYGGATAETATTLRGVSATPSFTDTITPPASLYYKVVATNAVGDSPASEPEQLAMTASAPTLTATNLTAERIALSWLAPADLGGEDVDGYRLERSDDGGDTWDELADGLANTSWNDDDVTENATYSYRVTAVTTAGDGESASATKQVRAAPWSVTGLARTGGVNGVSVTLGWNAANTGGSAVTNYTLCWGASAYVEIGCDNAVLTTSKTHVTGTIYHYWVRATNAIGTGPNSSAVEAKNAPAAPTVALTNTTAGRIGLSWDAPNMGGGTFASYTIYRSTDTIDWYTLATATSTNRSWNDDNVSANTTYHYRVAETNEVGQGANSTDASKRTAGIPWPATITMLYNPLTKLVTISWPAAGNGGSAITGYEIWRGTTSGTEVVYDTTSVFSPWTETIASNKDYYYKVRALNAVGGGNLSNEVQVHS